jgi:iron(III) transport system substrate-binding protein
MKSLLYILLSVIALIAIAVGPSGTGTPSKRPERPAMLILLCTPQILWCEGMKPVLRKGDPQVTVDFVRLSSGEALMRLRNERVKPQFDI